MYIYIYMYIYIGAWILEEHGGGGGVWFKDVRGACRGSLRKLDVAMVTFPACTLKLSDT